MKTLSVFVAVAIVLTVMCSQQSSAVPGEELEETIFLEIPDAVMDETVMDSMKVRASKIKVLCNKGNNDSNPFKSVNLSLSVSFYLLIPPEQ
uniref:Uncharacterized protein n=1 Tax=Gouania willdenowi TaxID=441366 RepID=A0A8C5EC41_GOUWI